MPTDRGRDRDQQHVERDEDCQGQALPAHSVDEQDRFRDCGLSCAVTERATKSANVPGGAFAWPPQAIGRLGLQILLCA